jgi:hypothetical protein
VSEIEHSVSSGPALAALAERYWAERHSGGIPFLVSLNAQHGRQAAGSIAFDLPYRVETLEEGDPAKAAWFDVNALKREGALLVMTAPPPNGVMVMGEAIENIETFERPMLRGGRPHFIYFGELPGRNPSVITSANEK